MIRRILLLLALALPLAAQTRQVTIVPAAPTTADPIEIRIPLYCPSEATITFEGPIVRIDLDGPADGCPIDPPLLVEQSVKIGPMNAGEYDVRVYGGNDRYRPYATGAFTVTPHVELYPFAIPANVDPALDVVIPFDDDASETCQGAPCTHAIVGGVTVPLRHGIDYDLIFRAPQHAPGFVDVTLTGGTKSLTLKNALYYFDRAATPDFDVFERILFPVLFDAPGALGSHWITEAAIGNPEKWDVETFNDITSIVCTVPPCGERVRARSKLAWTGGNYPSGVALIVARRDADDLAFALRARDTAHAAQSFGTEVPVVRESEMFESTMTLLDVPLDPRYRVKLRIYAYAEGDARLLGLGAPRTVRLTRPECSGASCAWLPAYATIDLAPGSADQRVNLYIEPPAGTKAFAFATVTNNETQQVTTVTPDGVGGVPCNPCTIP